MTGLLLRNGVDATGATLDVRCADGRIAAVGLGGTLDAEAGDDVYELGGWLLLPALAEPHAHLDKALTADRVPNPTGDLVGAVEAWGRYRERLTLDDIVERAERAARILLANGTTAIRTHVDVADNVGMRCVEALGIVGERLAGLVDLQVVALVAPWGDWGLLREAMAAGAHVVGGCPHLAGDRVGMQTYCLEVAGELDLPVDLHTDENLDADSADLRAMAAWVRRTGFGRGVAASHCCSLGVQDEVEQADTAAEVAEAGVAVITLPQTNLFLQGRDHRRSTPRGLTALRPLLRAGVVLAAGGDNLQDPFNLVGRGDPLEAASLLVTAGHLLPDEAYEAVSNAARRAIGLEPVTLRAGSPADLMALPAASPRAAIAFAPSPRVVVRAGRLVAVPDETKR